MRKHFLLLFLMALLPLAGWAQTDLSDGWAITFTPTSPQTYTGNNLLPTVTLTHTSYSPITTGFNVVWKNENGVVVTEAKNVGWYEATVTGDMSTTYGELATPSKKFYILKATPTVSTPHELMGTVAYDGEEHALVTTAPVYTFGTVEYSLDQETWSAEIPTAKKVGMYTVYTRVQGTNNWTAIAPAALTGTAKITGTGLTEGTDYTAPTAIGAPIPFDNANHALANAGDDLTDKCKMKYSLDGTNWQTTVPEAKNVGSYTVRWKAEAIDGYVDATGTLAATTISAAAPTVTRATAATGTLTYAGVAQSLLSAPGTATIGATPKYVIQYKANESDPWGAVGEPVAYADVKGTKAGYYHITTKVVGGGNYNESVADGYTDVQINKAQLTVITDPKTKVYGQANPTLTVSYTGFKNGENATVVTTAPTLSTTAINTSAVGTYKITATEGTAVAENYTFVYNEANYGDLTITQKELNTTDFAFALAETEKVYTGSPLTTTIAAATYTAIGDMSSPADYTYVCSNNTDAGTANVIISGQGNYKGSIVLNFTINPKPVYIQPKNNSKAYGAAEPNPLTTYDLTATAGGAAIAGATLNGTVTFARVAGENVGTYKIYVKSFTAGDAGNYTISPSQKINQPDDATADNRTATFTVAPAGEGLVLKFKDDIDAAKKTKVYGEANPTWTVEDMECVSGLVNGDDWATVKASLSAPTFALTSENVGAENKVTLTAGFVSANYPTVTVLPMDFEVTARPITVTVDPQVITYGAELTAAAATPGTNWSVTAGSIHVGDALGISFNTVKDLSTYGVAAEAYEGAITAAITNDNYDLTVVNGNLTVTPGAAITLKNAGDMDALISAYDGQDITVTLNRNINRTEAWFAMVLPFRVTMKELVDNFGYCVVNVLDETNEDAKKVKFKLAFNTIEANQPFLVKLSTPIATPVGFGLKSIEYAAAPERHDVAGNKFHGVFKSTDLAANANYWVMVPAQDKFKKLDAEGTTLNPINCYLETAQELDSFARSIFVEEADGTVTAINAVSVDGLQKSNEGWYTIGGVKLQSAPTEKGVYIKDGKKFVIK